MTLRHFYPGRTKFTQYSRLFVTSASSPRMQTYSSSLSETFYNDDQKSIQQKVAKILEAEVFPYVNEWEAIEQAPTRKLIKILGNEGLLGIRFSKEDGGQGLDYKHQAAYLEELGSSPAAGAVAGIVGHTEITLPALSSTNTHAAKFKLSDNSDHCVNKNIMVH